MVFWATWCAPCRAEIPHLIAAKAKFGEKPFEIVGVSLDEKGSDAIRSFAIENKMSWPIVRDEAGIASAYGVSAIPALFLIDGTTGKILADGNDLSGDQMLRTIERHLK